MKHIKRIIIFFGTFMLYHIVFSSFFPVDENNVLQAPDWYVFLGLGIAVMAAIAFTRKKKTKQIDSTRSNPDSLISYLRGTSSDIPPDNVSKAYTAPVEFEPEYPPIRPDWNPESDLMSIDQMEGHDFEYWCAALLRKIGFYNVEVTQGSGDQGVDVLAEKDGIRYAVQCKCYSKDLGNKPVQEVSSGKMMPQYHCQIGAVMTNRYFTKGAQELAAATGTLLWDRDWIQNQLKFTGSIRPDRQNTQNQPQHHNNKLLEDIMEDFFRFDGVSVSHVQHRFGLDHDYAAFILNTLEEHDFIVQAKGDRPGYVKISYEMWQLLKRRRTQN